MNYPQEKYIEAREMIYYETGIELPDNKIDRIVSIFATVPQMSKDRWIEALGLSAHGLGNDDLRPTRDAINAVLAKSPVIAAAPVDGMVDRVRELEDAIRWALGEVGDFPARGPAQGAYWWRSELLRRARLTKPKTPHERVTIRPRGLDYAVDLDGTMDEFFINPAHAENYRLGLIETLKKEGSK